MTTERTAIHSPTNRPMGEMRLTEDFVGTDIWFYGRSEQEAWRNGDCVVYVVQDDEGFYKVSCKSRDAFVRDFDDLEPANYWVMGPSGVDDMREKINRAVFFEGKRVAFALTDPLGLVVGRFSWGTFEFSFPARRLWDDGRLQVITPKNRESVVKLERIVHYGNTARKAEHLFVDLSIYNVPVRKFDEVRDRLFDLLGIELNVRFHNDESEFDDE